MQLDYPYRIDGRGKTAESGVDDHLRHLVEQLLFTNPGERVNRPDFGSGLRQLVFGPNSDELAAALQFTVQAALQQVLGDRIESEEVAVEARDATLKVTVRYRPRGGGDAVTARFEREL